MNWESQLFVTDVDTHLPTTCTNRSSPNYATAIQPKRPNFAEVGFEYTNDTLHKYTQESTVETLEPNKPQRECPAACVIAQQYFSATFSLLRFHSRKDKFGALLKDVI
jgi:hypothetical protein